MNRIPDKMKIRRQYLRKKGSAYSIVGFTWFVSSAGFATATICIMLLIIYRGVKDSPLTDFLPWLNGGLIGGVVVGIVGSFWCYEAKARANSIAYIPPVRQQLPTLPADEVLLRGSQVPSASPEELLRSVDCVETPAEELLRAARGPSR